MRSVLTILLSLTVAIQMVNANATIPLETSAIDSDLMIKSESGSKNDSSLHKTANPEGDANNGALSKSQLENDDTAMSAAPIKSDSKDKADETTKHNLETSSPTPTHQPTHASTQKSTHTSTPIESLTDEEKPKKVKSNSHSTQSPNDSTTSTLPSIEDKPTVATMNSTETSTLSSNPRDNVTHVKHSNGSHHGENKDHSTTKEAIDAPSTAMTDIEIPTTSSSTPISSSDYVVIVETPEYSEILSSAEPEIYEPTTIYDLMDPITLSVMEEDVTEDPKKVYTETPIETMTEVMEVLEELTDPLYNMTELLETTTAGGNSIYNYNYIVNDYKTNTPCILASMNVTLQVTYSTTDNQTVSKKIHVPTSASARGVCNDNQSSLILSWSEEWTMREEDSITFGFVKDDAQFYLDSVQVAVFLDNKNFPNALDLTMEGNSTKGLQLFSASLSNGKHVCNSETDISCGKILVQIHSVHLIAFNDKPDVSNRKGENCSILNSVNVAALIGILFALVVALAILTSYAWYRKRTSVFRSELP